MERMIAHLAEAQGLSEALQALVDLREGIGVRDEWDLLRLPASLRAELLTTGGDSEADLSQGLAALERRIEDSPPDQRAVLEVAFNVGQRFGTFAWQQRAEAATQGATPDEQGEFIWRSDLALLQLLMRAHPAAEAVPAPEARPPKAPRRGRAEAFFAEDYVINSEAFREAWESALTVDMWGFGHNRMAVAYSSQMVSMLSRGGRLRILLQNPEGQGVIEANQRSSTPKASEEAVRYQHRAGVVTLQAVCEAAKAPADAMQIRYFDGMPPFTAYFFNAEAQKAQAFIWFWSWRQPSSWRPGFRIQHDSDELWFDRFHQQFVELWGECDDQVIPSGGLS